MEIKPYILLADKKTAVYNPHRLYSQSEVYGIVFSDTTGEHIRVLSPKILEKQELLRSGVQMPLENIYPNEVDALFDFNGKKNTSEFENAGSIIVKNIKEQCGDEWFIPALGELIAAIRCRDEIDNLLSHIKSSYRLWKSIYHWTSTRCGQYCAYGYYGNGGDLLSYYFYHDNSVVPITFLSNRAKRHEIKKNKAFNPSTNEIHLSNSNELLIEISNVNTSVKIYQ